jgi:hypothetical protein
MGSAMAIDKKAGRAKTPFRLTNSSKRKYKLNQTVSTHRQISTMITKERFTERGNDKTLRDS